MKRFYKFPLSLAMSVILVGCIDNEYDLSNIDTNAELSVNDLVLPINIDNITLRNIFDIEENGHVRVIDGEYALVEDGSFESEQIYISEIYASRPYLDPITQKLPVIKNGNKIELSLIEIPAYFSYEMYNVNDCLISIDKASTEFSITFSMTLKELEEKVNGIDIKNLSFQLPQGLTADSELGEYNSETGILHVGDTRTVGNKISVTVNVHGINFNNSVAKYDYSTHSFKFADDLSIKSGTFVITENDLTSGTLTDIPTVVNMVTDYTMTDIHITSFDGVVKYKIDGLNIEPISLTDIPAVLNQEGTDIRLVNPQIYISLNNPLSSYGLNAKTGFEIAAYRNNSPTKYFTLDDNCLDIICNKGDIDYQYCMSPTKPEHYLVEFSNAEFEKFSSLGDIISGNGLPQRIGVKFTETSVPEQAVKDFKLNYDYGTVVGKYELFAPFAFKDKSDIIYRETVDGWNNEDLDALTISQLDLIATITSELPIEIDLLGYPIDVNGNQINDVHIDGAIIQAGAKEQDFDMRISGEITHLDGISFVAMAIADDSQKVLKPDMKITLKDIKVKVTGKYNKEL